MDIRDTLNTIVAKGLKREFTEIDGPVGTHTIIDGKEVLLLCSNDYLGLANHPDIKSAAIVATEKYGTGAGAARLVSGTLTPHTELEARIKDFKGAPAALLFNSGYMANTGAIPALIGRTGEIFSDKLNHASIIDGCVLSRAKLTRYKHCDLKSLERALKGSHTKAKLIITDGVFSMDGDVAPIRGIIELATKYDALVYIDDAHGTGVLGASGHKLDGRGTLSELNIEYNPRVIEMATFGKAFGGFGAAITGSEDIIELLKNKARSFIFATALPPAVCAANIKAIDIVERDTQRRVRLKANAELVRIELKKAGLDTLSSSTHIIPILIGDAERTVEISKQLLNEEGIFIQAIRPPTVAKGTARLRLTVSSEHRKDKLLWAVKKIAEVIGG